VVGGSRNVPPGPVIASSLHGTLRDRRRRRYPWRYVLASRLPTSVRGHPVPLRTQGGHPEQEPVLGLGKTIWTSSLARELRMNV